MSTEVTNRDGKAVHLLNPAEKGLRYARELRNKTKRDGTPLTEKEAGFRSGYLSVRSEEARIYVKKHGLVSKRVKKNDSYGDKE
jgi:hypothetical protein